MTDSWTITGLMAFFALVTLGAAGAPLLLLPRWMDGIQARRIAFHRSAIAVITAELGRPQLRPAQVHRLRAQRQRDIAALLSLAPGEVVPPLPVAVPLDIAA